MKNIVFLSATKAILTLFLGLGALLIVSSGVSAKTSAEGPFGSSDLRLEMPIQTDLTQQKMFKKSGHRLTAVAEFQIKAKILSKKEYRDGREANIAPIDLALGWGRMASERLLSKLSISQKGRFASINYASDDQISRNDIIQNSSNMHMVPISRDVKNTLLNVKEGQIVQIKGYLVNIRHVDGWRWLTSTTRTDEGNGACEIILVQSIEVKG